MLVGQVSRHLVNDLLAIRFIYSSARLFRRATSALCVCRRSHCRCACLHLREAVLETLHANDIAQRERWVSFTFAKRR